jgi:VanZ family protein
LQKNYLKRRPWSYLIAATLWFLISVVLLTLPGSAFPKETWLDKIPLFDKMVHVGMFGILVTLWCLTWYKFPGNAHVKNWRKLFIQIAIVGLCYGIVMEFVQHYYVANRSFEGADIIADAVGCTAGAIFSTRRYIKK